MVEISSSVVIADKQIVVKETKTDRVRRVAIDRSTAAVVAEHRARCEERASACGIERISALLPSYDYPLRARGRPEP